jgi:hypothetical protein
MALDAPGGPTTAFRHIAACSRCLPNRDQRPGLHPRATRTRPGEPAVRHITRRIDFYGWCPRRKGATTRRPDATRCSASGPNVAGWSGNPCQHTTTGPAPAASAGNASRSVSIVISEKCTAAIVAISAREAVRISVRPPAPRSAAPDITATLPTGPDGLDVPACRVSWRGARDGAEDPWSAPHSPAGGIDESGQRGESEPWGRYCRKPRVREAN